MLHSTALTAFRATGHAVQLAARPRGVLHVASTNRPGGGAFPGLRPVCGTRCRRLYRHGEGWNPSVLAGHESGRALCRRCSARAEACSAPTSPRAGQHHTMSVQDALCAAFAVDSTAELDLALQGVLDCYPTVPMLVTATSPCGPDGAGAALAFGGDPMTVAAAFGTVRRWLERAPERERRASVEADYARHVARSA